MSIRWRSLSFIAIKVVQHLGNNPPPLRIQAVSNISDFRFGIPGASEWDSSHREIETPKAKTVEISQKVPSPTETERPKVKTLGKSEEAPSQMQTDSTRDETPMVKEAASPKKIGIFDRCVRFLKSCFK